MRTKRGSGFLGSGRTFDRQRRQAVGVTFLGTGHKPRFNVIGGCGYRFNADQRQATGRATIVNTSVADRRTTSRVVMTNIVAVMYNRRRAVLVAAEQTGEQSAQGQEREKADDNAVPLHDPEYRS